MNQDIQKLVLNRRDFADNLLSKSKTQLTFVDCVIDWGREPKLFPKDIEKMLYESSMKKMLVPRGGTLSCDPPCEYYPDLELFVCDETFKNAGLRVWGKNWNFSDGSWLRNFDIHLHYAHDRANATQSLVLSISNSGFHIHSDVYSANYAETGYEGHRERYCYKVSSKKFNEFFKIVDELVARTMMIK